MPTCLCAGSAMPSATNAQSACLALVAKTSCSCRGQVVLEQVPHALEPCCLTFCTFWTTGEHINQSWCSTLENIEEGCLSNTGGADVHGRLCLTSASRDTATLLSQRAAQQLKVCRPRRTQTPIRDDEYGDTAPSLSGRYNTVRIRYRP